MLTLYLNTITREWFDANGEPFPSNMPEVAYQSRETVNVYLKSETPDAGGLGVDPAQWPADTTWAGMDGVGALLTIDSDFTHKLKGTLGNDLSAGAVGTLTAVIPAASQALIPQTGVVRVFSAVGDVEALSYTSRSIDGTAVTFTIAAESTLENAYSAGFVMDCDQAPYCAAYFNAQNSDLANGFLSFDVTFDSARLRETMDYSDNARLNVAGMEVLLYRVDTDGNQTRMKAFLLDTLTLTGTLGNIEASAEVPDVEQNKLAAIVGQLLALGFDVETRQINNQTQLRLKHQTSDAWSDWQTITYLPLAQYSVDGADWHDTAAETDRFSRFSFDAGVTWSAGVRFGLDGASAYEVAQENGFEGTADEWLASLKGEPGDFDARGLASALSNYDGQGKGFTYYATDTGYYYSKNSDLSGDWSEAHYWGGPQGEPGPQGIQGPQGAIVTGGLDYAFATTTETGNSVTFTLEALGVSSQCEWDVINSDGLNVTGDVRISRQWTDAGYIVTFAGGWPEGSWKLRPAGIKGNDGTTTPAVDHVYYSETYGTVIYLDDDNAIQVVGYQGDAWRTIELYLVSADSSVAGNIVLELGENRLVAPVTATLSKLTWNLQTPTAGNISVTRNYIDSEDTLKDGDSVVTALLVDWRIK